MLIERILHINPNKVALTYQGKTYTYGQLLKEIHQRQAALRIFGHQLLLCHKSPVENLFNFLSCISLGKKAVIASKDFSDDLLQKYGNLHSLEIVNEVIKNSPSGTFQFESNRPDDLFLGVLSSGSTGESKIIWKDYQSWFSAFSHQSEVFGIDQNDIVFAIDALAYSANLNTVLHALWLGASVVMDKLQNASNWSHTWQQNCVTSVFLVPSHLRLLSQKQVQNKQIRSIVTAGEKLSGTLAAEIMGLFPEALLTEYYGAAELGHISYIQGQDIIIKSGSVGKAFPEVSIQISGNRIHVHSPYVAPAYRDHNTVGDFGYICDQGFLYLLGREGRMFNRRGLNIFAQEIENAALDHPLVKEVCAVQKDQNIVLFVSKDNFEHQIDLRDYLLKSIPHNKLPNKIITLRNLPRNSSGKVDFRVLNKMPISEEDPLF